MPDIEELAVMMSAQFDLRHNTIDEESMPHRVPDREERRIHAI